MSQRAKTDDDLGVKRSRPQSGGTSEKREWIRKVLGIDIETVLALDLQTTTTQASVDNATRMLLHQVMEIIAPIKILPPAQTPQLAAALLSIHNIRTELGGKP